jgi:hypothetical protein
VLKDKGDAGPAEPVLHCYPREDRQFLADAQRAVRESRVLVARPQQLLEDVRRRLKAVYPAARIERRHRLAAGDDPNEVWYCYRDGTLVT